MADIRPAEFDPPPEREAVPYALEVEAHRIRTAAEMLAGHRERLRGEGEEHAAAAAMLERVEEHLVWALARVGEVAAGLRQKGWKPAAPPPPPGRMNPWGLSPDDGPRT